jgi:hypothetical protein
MYDFTETDVLAPLTVTGVGSLPHTSPGSAVQLIVDSLEGAPHPPQLPFADPREQMWIQFSEGLPRFKVDLESLSYSFDTTGDPLPEIEEFYNHYLTVTEGGTAVAFDIGPQYGQGIHAFLERLQRDGTVRPLIKVQVTGPLSFALTVTDENKRPIFYHPLFKDVAVKGIGLKAVRLLEMFKPLAENVIVIFDEPSMSAYGSSAFLGVSKADVIESLDEVISLVADRGGIAGVHCCGNTDWGILMETSTRIINFDAVDYMDTMAIYGSQVQSFVSRGGVLSWGAVPNTPQIENETAADVVERIERGMRTLEAAGVDRDAMTRRMIVTPACGCASLTVPQTQRVYGVLSELEKALTTHTFGNDARPRFA